MRAIIPIIAAGVGATAIAIAAVIFYKRISSKRYVAVTAKKIEYDGYDAAREEFIESAKAFIGIFEPIYKISIGRLKNKHSVFADWEVRVGNLSGSNAFQALWKSNFSGFDSWNEETYTEKAKQLMELLNSFGIERSGDTVIMVDKDTYKRYSTLDGDIIEIGNMARVLSPCWLLNGNTLEKGFIEADQQKEGGRV